MPSKNNVMKTINILPDVNAPNKANSVFSKSLDTQVFTDCTSDFLNYHFGELNKYKLREKRFLDFETPNRVRITHEYDIEINNSKDIDYKAYHFLFNPNERLSWLKIEDEKSRLSVADEKTVKKILRKKLDVSDSFFKNHWNMKQGLPCFIKINKNAGANFVLSASYFCSVNQKHKRSWIDCFCSIFMPIQESVITYYYYPLKNKSSWLYIKSPKNFIIKPVNTDNDRDYESSNKIEESNTSVDPEKVSFTIKNNIGDRIYTEGSVEFKFIIGLPLTLKIWYLVLFYTALSVFITLGCYFINNIILTIREPLFNNTLIQDLVNHKDFSSFVILTITAIIATRGWLIIEETILKRYSIYITCLMFAIMILQVLNMIF